MRTSIRKIFNNWKLQSIILIALLGAVTFTTVEEYTSFNKIENLKNQKELVFFITEIGREDLELANVQCRGKSTQLHFEHEKLQNIHGYDVIGQYLLGQSSDYEHDLEQLKLRAVEFTESAKNWYAEDKKELKKRERAMRDARNRLLVHIDGMIQTNAAYDYEKFMIQQVLVYLSFVQAFLMLVVFSSKFSMILRDINSLHAIDADDKSHVMATEEADIIAKRMNRKPQISDNPAMIDPLTGLHNAKGLQYAFANKKGMKDGSYTTVCLFEIDGFNELDAKYQKTFTQAVLKKIAFMISLYEQQTDTIARTDYNQFAVVFARTNRDQALSDCENIRASIAEAAFKVPKGDVTHLSVTGGVAVKLDSSTFEETLQQAKEVLAKARIKGKSNEIVQVTDLI